VLLSTIGYFNYLNLAYILFKIRRFVYYCTSWLDSWFFTILFRCFV